MGFTPELIGFYVCCTIFGVTAAIAAVAFMVLPELFPRSTSGPVVGWISLVLCVLSGLGTFVLLARTRRPK